MAEASETTDLTATPQECTATGAAWGSRPNPLMTPECRCPACTAQEEAQLAAVAEHRDEERHWLRASGQRQRQPVTVLELGTTGREALG